MANEIAEHLIKRYEGLFSEFATHRQMCQDVADFYLPYKANIIRKRLEGQEARDHLFTGTGTRAAKRLAANLHGSMTSSGFQWFGWKDPTEEMQKIQSIAAWWEAASMVGFKAFHAPESNFDSQQHESFLDLVVFHTACKLFEIVTHPDGSFNHFAFKTIGVGTYVFDEDEYGIANLVIRRFDMALRNAVKKFGEENIPKVMRDAYNQKKPDKQYPFLHVAMPSGEYEKAGGEAGDKPHSSIFISVEGKQIVKEEGYYTFPYTISRWDKASGNRNGSGPAWDSLPDLKSLNKTRELKLDASGMAIRPPMRQDDDGVIGDIDLTPGGNTIVRAGAKFEPIMTGYDPRVAEITEQSLINEINESFFYNDLQLPSGGRMTAEEVVQRIELINRLLGPTAGRIQSEDLSPTTKRAFVGLYMAGAFPPLPAEMEQGKQPTPRYEGPLARAQRGVQIEAILKTRTIAERIAAGTETKDVFDNFDEDQEVQIAAEILGYPAAARRSPKAMKALRQQRSEAAAMAQLPQQVKDAGAGAKNFAEAIAVPQNGIVPGQGQPGV